MESVSNVPPPGFESRAIFLTEEKFIVRQCCRNVATGGFDRVCVVMESNGSWQAMYSPQNSRLSLPEASLGGIARFNDVRAAREGGSLSPETETGEVRFLGKEAR